jgi:hypothetical protein
VILLQAANLRGDCWTRSGASAPWECRGRQQVSGGVGQQSGRGREALGELVHDSGVLGEDVEGAQLPEMRDGKQDASAVADLMREDAAASAGLAGAAASLVSEPLGVGGLSGPEALGELVQLLPAHPVRVGSDRCG